MGYSKNAYIGVAWTSLFRVALRSTAFIRVAILARILSPEQFGVFGVAVLVLALLEIVTETGINVFLLQEDDRYADYLDTAYVVSAFRGFVIAAGIFLTSGLIANFFHTPAAQPLLVFSSLIPIIRGFINPACIRYQKELKFRSEFLYRTVLVLTEASVAIIVSLLTRSPVGLVWGLVVSALVEVALSHILFSPHPKFTFDRAKFRQIASRGKWVTGFGLLDYIFTQGDNITVGRLLGTTSLGIYQTAYRLSTLPITEVVDVAYKVLLPILVKISDDTRRFRAAAFKSAGVIAVSTLITGSAIGLFADPLVRIILGPKWLSAIEPLRVLAILGIVRGMSFSFNPVFMAKKKQHYVTAIIGCNTLGLVVTIVPLVQLYGLVGAAYSTIIGAALGLPFVVYFTKKELFTNQK